MLPVVKELELCSCTAGNNNMAALWDGLVLRNPLHLEVTSSTDPLRGQSDIVFVYMLPTTILVNTPHGLVFSCLLGGCTILMFNKIFLSYVCYRLLDAQGSTSSIPSPSSEKLHVLCHRTLLHIQNEDSS